MAAQMTAFQPPADRPVLDADTPVAWDYDHLSLVPRVVSTLLHRVDAKADVAVGPAALTLPLLASPMPDVCGLAMCEAIGAEGAMGVLHRFHSIERQAEDLRRSIAALEPAGGRVAAAVGVTGDYQERCAALVAAGCHIVCLDTANGAHVQTQHALEWVKSTYPSLFVIAGNVASAEGFRWLEDRGADAIRVGLAGGAVCETRTETGVYVPTLYAVAEAASVRKRALIIGDAGVRTPSDMCKLIAMGADVVMMGSAFAGTKESPGHVISIEGKKFKILRGAASFSVQQQARGEDPVHVEGAETMVPYKGAVRHVLHRYIAGLRSSMSYMNARSLDEYRANAQFVRLA